MTNYLIYVDYFDDGFAEETFVGVNDKSDFDKIVNKFKELTWYGQIIKGKSEQVLREISERRPRLINLSEHCYVINDSDFVLTKWVDYNDLDTVNNNSVTSTIGIQGYLEYLDSLLKPTNSVGL